MPAHLYRALAVTAVLGGLLLPSTKAAADPIVITSGTLDAEAAFGDVLTNLLGDGFHVNGLLEGNLITEVEESCRPCETVSPTVTLGGTFPGTGFAGGGGPATVDGVTYPSMSFAFESGAISTPSVQLSGSGPTTVHVPFTFNAVMKFFLGDPVNGSSTPIFTRELTGTGMASASFFGVETDGRLLHSIDSNVVYDFGSAAPVPEPATWLLVSAGAMAWSAGRRMRRSRRESPEA